jgi:ParB family chromosome partitioning protein
LTTDLPDLAPRSRQGVVKRPAAPRRWRRRLRIIAGERRWRAAQRAGLREVPAVDHDVSDREALELAIIENVQRADLNPLEEAIGYQQLIDEHGYSQGQLGEVIGKSRPHIANTLVSTARTVRACAGRQLRGTPALWRSRRSRGQRGGSSGR